MSLLEGVCLMGRICQHCRQREATFHVTAVAGNVFFAGIESNGRGLVVEPWCDQCAEDRPPREKQRIPE
jgi:protein-arginine kinase activator protein McsA